jgi:hypothetical protein
LVFVKKNLQRRAIIVGPVNLVHWGVQPLFIAPWFRMAAGRRDKDPEGPPPEVSLQVMLGATKNCHFDVLVRASLLAEEEV